MNKKSPLIRTTQVGSQLHFVLKKASHTETERSDPGKVSNNYPRRKRRSDT